MWTRSIESYRNEHTEMSGQSGARKATLKQQELAAEFVLCSSSQRLVNGLDLSSLRYPSKVWVFAKLSFDPLENLISGMYSLSMKEVGSAVFLS